MPMTGMWRRLAVSAFMGAAVALLAGVLTFATGAAAQAQTSVVKPAKRKPPVVAPRVDPRAAATPLAAAPTPPIAAVAGEPPPQAKPARPIAPQTPPPPPPGQSASQPMPVTASRPPSPDPLPPVVKPAAAPISPTAKKPPDVKKPARPRQLSKQPPARNWRVSHSAQRNGRL